jgi:NADH-quinone oxidoreductase subunit H
LQPFADGLKLLFKESIFPKNANKRIFIFAPILAFALSLLPWAVIPFNAFASITDFDFGVLYILVISSLNVYSLVLAGWSSNSKYAFLGAIRSTAQIVSYEISMGLVLLTILILVGSLRFSDIVNFQKNCYFIVAFLPLAIIFFISLLAETNRTPFDLSEAEAELVAGYNVEYSSLVFALFFLAEYSNMISMSAFFSLIFLGGWHFALPLQILPGSLWFASKISLCLFVFVWIRATFPRYRYDQLMKLGWKVFLPVSLSFFIFFASFFKWFV